MGFETYVTLQEAVQKYGLDAKLLAHHVEQGQILGGKLNGTIVLLENDAQRLAHQQATKDQLREKVAHLEGWHISIGEAARKYDLSHPSISRWAKAGYIRVVHRGGQGKPTFVDESDVAYAHELVKHREAGQGKRVFTAEFRPDWF